MLQRSPGANAVSGLPALPENGDARRLVNELLATGFEPALVVGDAGLSAGGAAISLSVRNMSVSQSRMARETERVRRLLTLGMPVTVRVGDAGERGEARMERILRRLHRATDGHCIDRRRLSLAVAERDLAPPAFLLESRSWLGDGPRYLLVDGALTTAGAGLWSKLYRQRSWRRGLRPVVAGAVHSSCPLLSDETGDVPLSRLRLLAPPGSAWLPLAVNACRFCDRRGAMRDAVLHAALDSGLALADELFDCLEWPERAQRRDAYLNRRIVFVLQGLGDLVKLRRVDPASMACLRDLDRLVAGVHARLWQASRQLAARRGLLPSLAERDPARALADGEQRRRWQSRWRAALESAAVRHRNLLALSPYALLPSNGAADGDWLDLLPLLAHADVVSFAGGFSFAGWTIGDYKAFHRRAAAVIRRRNRAAFVATGV